MDWLYRWSVYSPEHLALQMGETGEGLTYRQMYVCANTLAGHLQARFSVKKGDRVICVAQNDLDYVVLFFALQRLGAILVPVNFRLAAPEVEHIVVDCGPRLVILEGGHSEIGAAISSLTEVWNFDGGDSLKSVCQSARHMRAVSSVVPFASGLDDTAMILYTSGTTGAPKGAIISQRMIFWNSVNTGLRLNLTSNEVVLTFLPLFHTGGWNVLTTPCLHRGAKVVLLKKFDADLVLDLCASERVTVLFGVPTTMDFLRRSEGFSRTDLTSIRYAIVGGEPMPLDLIEAWLDRGVPVRQGYGLTEFGPNVFSLNEEDSRIKMGSIGFPNFYCQAKVVDERGVELGADQVGELVLRGPMVMDGYWHNPAATAEALRDGWLHTGDLVRRDQDGYYFVVGRKKDMFISGGENVYPAEVEKILRRFPGVREVAVIGVPHPRWGEAGRAFLKLDGCASSTSSEALRVHCLSHLAKFKIPAEFIVLSDLPKTESGKIAKNRLPHGAIE